MMHAAMRFAKDEKDFFKVVRYSLYFYSPLPPHRRLDPTSFSTCEKRRSGSPLITKLLTMDKITRDKSHAVWGP